VWLTWLVVRAVGGAELQLAIAAMQLLPCVELNVRFALLNAVPFLSAQNHIFMALRAG
jgi:hypothetical protein